MSDKYVNMPEHIKIRGARVRNLKNVDVYIPLHKIVGIAGVSGSGKSTELLKQSPSDVFAPVKP